MSVEHVTSNISVTRFTRLTTLTINVCRPLLPVWKKRDRKWYVCSLLLAERRRTTHSWVVCMFEPRSQYRITVSYACSVWKRRNFRATRCTRSFTCARSIIRECSEFSVLHLFFSTFQLFLSAHRDEFVCYSAVDNGITGRSAIIAGSVSLPQLVRSDMTQESVTY